MNHASSLTAAFRRLRPFAVGLALAVIAAAPPAALAGQESAQALLLRTAERYAGVGTICAEFEQRLSIPLLGDSRDSAGEVCQRRPNLFSMRFTDPDGDAVVADGEVFWVYYPSVSPGQVIRFPLDPSRGGLDFYREFLDEPLTKYEVADRGQEYIGEVTTRRVELIPLRDRGYQAAQVWIDPEAGLIRRVEVTEENGTIRRITLDGVRLDPSVPASTFQFLVPSGVSVVSR